MKPKQITLFMLLMTLVSVISFQDAGAGQNFGKFIGQDPRFDRLVPQDAVLEKIAEGFTWIEGPLWDRKGGYLLFSDMHPCSIMLRAGA